MTSYSFKKRAGTDTSDPEFVLQHCGKPTRVQIQDSSSWGGAYAVSVDHLDDEAEPHLLWVALSRGARRIRKKSYANSSSVPTTPDCSLLAG
jgi:hypothetical protein